MEKVNSIYIIHIFIANKINLMAYLIFKVCRKMNDGFFRICIIQREYFYNSQKIYLFMIYNYFLIYLIL